ncbi:MAG: ABC transporter permease [Cytophagales bacterium]|nr:ABC transporter permease [Cytophagales bacterium]
MNSAFIGAGLRKTLVIFQFSLSVILIFSAIVIHQQVEFLRSKALGYDKENVLYVETGQHIKLPFESFKNEALRNPAVESVAQAAASPMEINGVGEINWRLGGVIQTMNINNNPIDYDYLETLGFEILQGRNFSPERMTDSTAVIITETAANQMGFDNPIGQRVDFGFNTESEIIGVVKDFHNADIHDAMAPVGFLFRKRSNLWALEAGVYSL